MIKLPKKFTTTGVDLRIRHNKGLAHEGGSFSFKSELIELNVDKRDDLEVLQCLMHEEIEAALTGLGCRYVNYNNEYVFSFDHNMFCSVANEVAKGVLDLLRANGVK